MRGRASSPQWGFLKTTIETGGTVTDINTSIDIDGPRERVFDQLVNWKELTTWSTITGAHTGPDRCTRVGEEFTQKLKVAGVEVDSQWRVTEYDRPNVVAYEATGPGGSWMRMRQRVHPAEAGSRVELEVQYDLPGGVLGDVVDKLYVERRNEREAEHSLHNLKELIEGRQA